jgi:hypothetical protein
MPLEKWLRRFLISHSFSFEFFITYFNHNNKGEDPLTHLEERMIEKRWKLLSKEVIHGAHAGSIFRVDVLDDKNQRGSYIYKHCS